MRVVTADTGNEGILRLIGRGLSNAEIATEMVVAETTVKTHVARILGKPGVRDRLTPLEVLTGQPTHMLEGSLLRSSHEAGSTPCRRALATSRP